jgi:hypothetical protein
MALSLVVLLCLLGYSEAADEPEWDYASGWRFISDGRSTGRLAAEPIADPTRIVLTYEVDPDGFVLIRHEMETAPPDSLPITFDLVVEGDGNLEIKFEDTDGSVFGRKFALIGQYSQTTRLVVYLENLDYWWGGRDARFDGLRAFELAISGGGVGILLLSDIGVGRAGQPATFPPAGPILDPHRDEEGIGFRQRRAASLIPADPLVLEWLRRIQDTSSSDRALVPSQEDNEAQTFNNALVAMAFLLTGEKERAERILDFFAGATDRDNERLELQNFFYRGEPRGFYQRVNLNPGPGGDRYCSQLESHRWTGDMAWLLIAYKYYERLHGGERYEEVTGLLRDLLLDWYREADDGPGGYVGHGWRQGDAYLHEPQGHPEANVDCYAALRLCGETGHAEAIRVWLDRTIRGSSLPLDLYTWRAMAYGESSALLLDIPEQDLRYRKTLSVNGHRVMGLYHAADTEVDNIWLDGTGHMACAYLSIGDPLRGQFYANQLDAFLIDREIEGVRTRALPYTANRTGAYEWVHPDRGFVSVAAWYLFAKNRFNPLLLVEAH